MKQPIVVPQLGLVEFFTLLQWKKDSGAQVNAGEIVATIETEKADVEVESPARGTLEISVHAGPDLVPAATVLGYVEDGTAA